MKKLFLSILIAMVVLGVGQVALAVDSSVAVSPSSATKNAGSAFSVNVNLMANSNKVCVVKGTVDFESISCNSIALGSGLMAIAAPTCSSPSFTLGIPGCTTENKTLFTISAAGNVIGSSAVNLTGVKIYGDGAVISTTAVGGAYSITQALPQATVQEAQQPQQQVQEQPTESQQAPVLFDISAKQVVPKTSNFNLYVWLLGILLLVILLVILGVVEVFRRIKRKKLEKIQNMDIIK